MNDRQAAEGLLGAVVPSGGFSLSLLTSAATGRRCHDGFHHRFHFADLLVAEFGIFFQRAQNNFIQPHVNVNLVRRRFDLLAGQFAGKHLVKHHAQRVNVRAVIHLARRGDLLRRHVIRRAQDAGRAVLLRGPNVWADRQVSPTRFGFNNFRQAKIRHLHAAPAIQQNVLRLDVAVDDALVVRKLERVANLRHDGQRLARGNAAAREQLPQVHAVHEFHEEEVERRSSRRE